MRSRIILRNANFSPPLSYSSVSAVWEKGASLSLIVSEMAIPPELEALLPSVDDKQLDIDDVFEIETAVYDIASRWENFGAAVGVSRAEINKIDGEEKGADNCLTKVLEALLKMNHDVKKFGVPSWQMIARAVGQRNGGADLKLALTIAKDHSTSPETGGGGGGANPGKAPSTAPGKAPSIAPETILKKKPDTRLLGMITYCDEEGKTKVYRPLDRIAPHWPSIADYLKTDAGVIASCEIPGKKPRDSAREVMTAWLGSDVKASWSKLMKAMKTVAELTVPAAELRYALLNIVVDSDED